ncbi:MAG: hypothetical protein LBB67_08095 [Oscillospiraceae bacterium]|jgi:hypothetical protein|nr:hypothetical protein [Oscillospiraceae bacterium]
MKKVLVSVFGLLIACALAFTFVACGEKSNGPTTTLKETTVSVPKDTSDAPILSENAPTDPTVDTTDTTADSTVSVFAETVNGTTAVGASVSAATVKDQFGRYAPPANLASASTAEKLAYFNDMANAVRKAKPRFYRECLKEIQIKLSGFASIANPIVEAVKKQAMPGEWENETIAKGKGNDGKFLSENANASDLKVSDVSSITVTKSGANTVIKVSVKQEVNPEKGTRSAHSRVMCIADREDVFETITDISDQISADINDVKLVYNSGYAQITVDKDGKVIAADCRFNVDAVANNVKISIITTNVTAPQSTQVKCSQFVY